MLATSALPLSLPSSCWMLQNTETIIYALQQEDADDNEVSEVQRDNHNIHSSVIVSHANSHHNDITSMCLHLHHGYF